MRRLGGTWIGLGLLALWLLRDATPVVRLAAASLGMILVIKLAALAWQREVRAPWMSRLVFLFCWPGTSFSGFERRLPEPLPATGERFLEAWLTFLVGVALLLGVAFLRNGENLITDYLALLSVFLIVHLGLVEITADTLRLCGFTPPSLFDRPYLASSLRDFWSVRWNRAFVDMNRIFLLGPLRDRVPRAALTFSIFLLSGLLHELGISYADGVSWGKPLAYFLIQGVGMELERKRRFSRALLWAWVLLPLPLLFPPAFVHLFGGMLMGLILRAAGALPPLPAAFVLGGCLHLLVLCASVQVPGKLGWREDFARLRPLNRKVSYTYGAYIFSIIVFMAAVSFLLSREAVSRASLLWAAFIALFWIARVLTDFFYMSHDDWPDGPLFRVGHICLTTVFVLLALLYSAITISGIGRLGS